MNEVLSTQQEKNLITSTVDKDDDNVIIMTDNISVMTEEVEEEDVHVPKKYRSSRWGKSVHNEPQDLYITTDETIQYAIPIIVASKFKDKVFYDPFCGHNKFSR